MSFSENPVRFSEAFVEDVLDGSVFSSPKFASAQN
jgi:hypothetical protein